MDYVNLGHTGLRVSRLCAGTMSYGGPADEAASAALYAASREAGINFFDCADVYNAGRAEELLGSFVAHERDKVVIATKAYFPTGDGPNDRSSSAYHLVRAVEASLRRLKTDRIDLFYLHRHDDVTPLDETLRAVEDLRRAGKVLYVGASNFAAWQTARAVERAERHGFAPLVALQPMYNLVKRQAEVELLPMASAMGLGVCPYSPLGGGLLSGKYGVDRRPAQGRLVDNAMYSVRYAAAAYYALAERFETIARELGHHPAALAVAWVASHPAVTAPLLGARDVDQLRPALGALDIPMTAELRERLSALSPTPPPATDRNEEASSHHYGAVLRRV